MGEHYIIDGDALDLRRQALEAIQDHTALVFSVHALGKVMEDRHEIVFMPNRLTWAKIDSNEQQESALVVSGSVQTSAGETRAIASLSSSDDMPSDLEILSPQEL